jgi:hypothetical protein
MEWRQTSTVHANGLIEVQIPELAAGQSVEVVVRATDPMPSGRRPLGLLRGKMEIMPDFDKPLDEFDEHT